MRADEDIDLARRSSRAPCLTSAGVRKRETISTRTGKSLLRSRNVFQCCSARIVVGTSTSTCLPVDGDRERRAQGDLGLAEADVAAHEPVHRPRRLEILLDRLDRARLVLGLAVREVRLEPLEPFVLDGRTGCPGRACRCGVEGDQLAGELAARCSRGRRLESCPRPCRRASRAPATSPSAPM